MQNPQKFTVSYIEKTTILTNMRFCIFFVNNISGIRHMPLNAGKLKFMKFCENCLLSFNFILQLARNHNMRFGDFVNDVSCSLEMLPNSLRI